MFVIDLFVLYLYVLHLDILVDIFLNTISQYQNPKLRFSYFSYRYQRKAEKNIGIRIDCFLNNNYRNMENVQVHIIFEHDLILSFE